MCTQVLAGTVTAAQDSGADVVLCDTSGRLHTNWRLMDELQLVVQDIDGVQKGAPHETLLVLDGSTGLNMMNQVCLSLPSIHNYWTNTTARTLV